MKEISELLREVEAISVALATLQAPIPRAIIARVNRQVDDLLSLCPPELRDSLALTAYQTLGLDPSVNPAKAEHVRRKY
jgi:hypothetical protein